MLAAGTYDLPSTLSISRALTIEAEEAGTVVLDAKGRFGPVVAIKPGGTATLKGLDVTGGRLVSGLDVTGGAGGNRESYMTYSYWYGGEMVIVREHGAGLAIEEGGEANLNGCQVYENQATVRAPVPGPFLQRPVETDRVCAPAPFDVTFCVQLKP